MKLRDDPKWHDTKKCPKARAVQRLVKSKSDMVYRRCPIEGFNAFDSKVGKVVDCAECSAPFED